MVHLGTREAGTLCGKPVARRWWFEWPPKPQFGRIGDLVVRLDDNESPERHSDCEPCVSAAKSTTPESAA